MPKISLGTYTFRTRATGQAEGEREWENLGAIGPDERDYLDFLGEFCQQGYAEYEEDEDRQSLLTIDEFRLEDRTVYGFVRSGSWGASADIVDHRTRELEHPMSPNEAPLMPFFFLIYAPERSERGILVLQRHGRRGIKTHLGQALQRSYREWLTGYLTRLWQHVPGQVLAFLTEGEMRDVELISYEMPGDLHEFSAELRDETRQWDENRGEVRTRVVAKRGTRWPIPERFRDVIVGERTFHEVREELGVDADRIQITVDHHGTERTVDLADPQDVSPYYDITDEIELQNGHPVRDDMRAFVIDEFLPDLIEDVQGRYE